MVFSILKPLVLRFITSDKFKEFVVDLLEKLVEQTDNELDDRALQIVKKGLNIAWTKQE